MVKLNLYQVKLLLGLGKLFEQLNLQAFSCIIYQQNEDLTFVKSKNKSKELQSLTVDTMIKLSLYQVQLLFGLGNAIQAT